MTVVQTNETESPIDSAGYPNPRLLLVEGGDDQAVVTKVLELAGLDEFQVHSMGTNTSWSSSLKGVTRDIRFRRRIRAVGLIQDADNNPNATLQSCQGVLSNAGLSAPAAVSGVTDELPACGIFLFGSTAGHGSLEDVCLASFDDGRLACVDAYRDCLEQGRYPTSNSSKAKLQSYLSGLRRHCRSIKVAAERGQLDVTHAAFDPLRAFLANLASR